MVGVNKVILIGNLGKDPEVVVFDTAKKAIFPLATTEYYKNKEGQRVEQTEWHNIVCWRGLAEIAEKILKKGSQIYVEGKLRTRSWEDKEGNKRYITEVLAENFTVLANKNHQENNQEQEASIEELDAVLGDKDQLETLPF